MNDTGEIEISVIIPTYNRADLVRKAIVSVLGQTMKNIEIIVVDDGSTDSTARTLAEFGDRIRYLRQENAGPGPARNRGIEAAGGKWIAFLDSDDRWEPEKLEFQYRETIRLGAECSFHDSRHITGAGSQVIESWNRYVHEKTIRREPLGTGLIPDMFAVLRDSWHFFLMSTMLVRKEVLLTAGGFDPSLRTNQDVDLYLRLTPPYRVAYIDRVLLEYTPGPERSFEVASRIRGLKNGNGKAVLFLDRITILRKAISAQRGSADIDRVESARDMLRRQILSLFKVHLNNKAYLRAFVTAVEYFLAFLPQGFRIPGRRHGRAEKLPGAVGRMGTGS